MKDLSDGRLAAAIRGAAKELDQLVKEAKARNISVGWEYVGGSYQPYRYPGEIGFNSERLVITKTLTEQF